LYIRVLEDLSERWRGFDERWINCRFSTSYKRLEYSLGMTPVFWLKDCSPSVIGLALFVNSGAKIPRYFAIEKYLECKISLGTLQILLYLYHC
jgi:hypothetical protein